MNEDEVKKKRKESNIDMVIVHRNKYFGVNFSKRLAKEITFEEAFGLDFFDWDNMICIASDKNKKRYKEIRSKDETGFGFVIKECDKNE